MKKIIALLLALACLCTFLVACGDDGDDGEGSKPGLDLAPFNTALASTPATAEIDVTMKAGGVTLEGEYNAVYSGNAAAVTFTYDKLNTFGDEIPEEMVSEVNGSATVNSDGTVTGDALGAYVVKLINRSFTVDEGKMSCSVEGNALLATLTKENAKTVLGVDATGDVVLNVTLSGTALVGISMSYSTVAGEMTVVCLYTAPAAE